MILSGMDADLVNRDLILDIESGVKAHFASVKACIEESIATFESTGELPECSIRTEILPGANLVYGLDQEMNLLEDFGQKTDLISSKSGEVILIQDFTLAEIDQIIMDKVNDLSNFTNESVSFLSR